MLLPVTVVVVAVTEEVVDVLLPVTVVVVVVDDETGTSGSGFLMMIAPSRPMIFLVMSLHFSSVTKSELSANPTTYVPSGVLAGTVNVRTATSALFAATAFLRSSDTNITALLSTPAVFVSVSNLALYASEPLAESNVISFALVMRN